MFPNDVPAPPHPREPTDLSSVIRWSTAWEGQAQDNQHDAVRYLGKTKEQPVLSRPQQGRTGRAASPRARGQALRHQSNLSQAPGLQYSLTDTANRP